MTKRLSPAAIVALKEALCVVYWYKPDLRSFLQQCLVNPSILATLDWGNSKRYKRQIVADLVDYLCRGQDKHIGDLTKLCYEVCNIKSFKHLESLEDGDKKAERVRQAVEHLRQLVESHEDKEREEDAIAERQRRHAEKLRASAAVRQKLEEIKSRYMTLATSSNPQQRVRA